MKGYFVTKGTGQSNLACSKNETTSYDDALVNAGIGNINIVTVSSMIPPEIDEIPQTPQHWGDIIFCIMARNDGRKGSFISCALLVVEVYLDNKLQGSMVLEYSGRGNEKTAFKNLFMDLGDMIQRRNYGALYGPLMLYSQNRTALGYTIVPKKFIYNSLKIKKRHGTVISTICFQK